MTKQNYLDNIIPVIQKANPELTKNWQICQECKRQVVLNGSRIVKEHPISLEHVLKAMGDKAFDIRGKIFQESNIEYLVRELWSLGLTLSDQPLPTLAFLDSVLCEGK